MKPKLVTFDCAQTLIEVNWSSGTFAVLCAEDLNIVLPGEAASNLEHLYRKGYPHYKALHETRDTTVLDGFWIDLYSEWLRGLGIDADLGRAVFDQTVQVGFSTSSPIFQPYQDVVSCLERLQALGIQLAVLSNWDYSLHRVLEMFDLTKYFRVVFASLEEGTEKPEKEFFDKILAATGFAAEQTLHVGDNPIDDLQGARRAGIRVVLIDRDRPDPAPPYVNSLDKLEEAFEWAK